MTANATSSPPISDREIVPGSGIVVMKAPDCVLVSDPPEFMLAMTCSGVLPGSCVVYAPDQVPTAVAFTRILPTADNATEVPVAVRVKIKGDPANVEQLLPMGAAQVSDADPGPRAVKSKKSPGFVAPGPELNVMKPARGNPGGVAGKSRILPKVAGKRTPLP